MTTAAPVTVDRPLRLVEVLAEVIRAYGRSVLPLVCLGLLHTGAFLLQEVVPFGPNIPILAVAFAVTFGAIVLLLSGESVSASLRQLVRAAPMLLVVGFGVAAPFYLALSYVVFIPVAVVWLAVWAFAVPALLLEPKGQAAAGRGANDRFVYAMRRSMVLARTDFGHSLGVVLVLILIYLFVGILLAGLLASFGDNSQVAAIAIAQAVLAPFFFLGLGVLYFDQRARSRR